MSICTFAGHSVICSPVVEQQVNEEIKVYLSHIAAAKARGVRFGRPEAPTADDFPQIVKAWERGEITREEACKRCGVSQPTFYRRVREYQIAAQKAKK